MTRKNTLPARALGAAMGLWVGLALAQSPAPMPPLANVILGGGDRHCSSFNGAAAGRGCSADWATILAQDPAYAGWAAADISFDANYATPAFRYSLGETQLQKLRDTPAALMDAARKAALLAALAQQLARSGPQQQLEFAALDKLRGTEVPPFSTGLTPPEVAMLRAALVDTPPPTQRLREARSVQFASNLYVRGYFETFVAAARQANGGNTPLIGVVTASADMHPFADADVNVAALRSAGAQVVYLPINGGLRQALDRKDCAAVNLYYDSYANTRASRSYFHGGLVYPDLAQLQRDACANSAAALNRTLGQLNGLYFSGGDQARHLESLVSRDANGRYTQASAQLDILRARHAQGLLVVAGTSAGNHAQGGGLWNGKPVPMLGGGDSYEALRGGFLEGNGPVVGTPSPTGGEGKFPASVYNLGGLGFFRYGLLDSHFSVRTREGRLVRLTQQSGMDYGFGVDENTALLVSRPDAQGTAHFAVQGAAGVLIVDVRQAQARGGAAGSYAIDGVRLHYLQTGDTATIDAQGRLHVRLDANRALLPAQAHAAPVVQKAVLDYGSGNFRALAMHLGLAGASTGFGSTEDSKDRRSQQDQPFYSATLTRDAQTAFRGAAGQVSYTQLLLKFAPCSGPCAAP